MNIFFIVDISGSMTSGPKFSIISDLLDCSLYYLRSSKTANESENTIKTAMVYPSDNIVPDYFDIFDNYQTPSEIKNTNYNLLTDFIRNNRSDSLFFFFTDMTENSSYFKEFDNFYTVIVGNDNKESTFDCYKNTIKADCFINKFLTIIEKTTGELL